MSQFESEVGDAELDALFAQAREPNEADAGAAERFLAGHRVRVARTQAQIQTRPLWVRPRIPAKWLAAALASAAVIAGVGVLRPSLAPGDLPASAAYAAYQDALGEGW
ncbi:hypothetical protein [Deinococcus aquatilis]|jgi:uncharacterized membrane protein|uniref:hypothetical protein n=1 Tax=Deinococcus aquatilis TaxID=519440 RepID=UPI00037386DC|nr:hypothetical protein [Deinococcus aquatilis]